MNKLSCTNCWRWLKRKNRVYPGDSIPVEICGDGQGQINQNFVINDEDGLVDSFYQHNNITADHEVNSTPKSNHHVDGSIFNADAEQVDGINNININTHPSAGGGAVTPVFDPKYCTSHYIEVGKNKRIHVLHILPPPPSDEVDSNPMRQIPDEIQDHSDDEEDEFYFSKWSKRPRLKNNYGSVRYDGQINGRVKPQFVLGPADKQANKELFLSYNNSISQSQTLPLANSLPKTFQDISTTGTGSTITIESDDGYINSAFQSEPDDQVDLDLNLNTQQENNSNSNNNASSGASHNFQCQVEDNILGVDQDEIKTDENTNTSINLQNSIVLSPVTQNLKPILFFIHGISGSCEIWKSQMLFFEKLGYEIIAPDILGHGLSSTPSQNKLYLFESLVQDIVDVFDHFITEEDEKRCILIGHGYGACIATVLTRIRQKNIKLLISISGGGPTPLLGDGFEMSFFNFSKRKFTGRFDNPELKNVLPPKIHENMLRGQVWLEGDSVFHRRITIPTLLVHGLKDKIVNLVEECEMERTIPRAFLELVPNAGHMIMWEEPKKLNRMLYKFIEAWT